MITVDAAIIGGQKCGTTTLFHALARHPGVNAARAKESRVFLLPEAEHAAVLRSQFGPGPGLRLHAYAHAWSKRQALAAMARHNPEMRLVALTRPPVERIWSAYQFARRNGWESLPLDQALQAEVERRTGDHIAATELQYVANSRYDRLIDNVRRVFAADQLLVLPLSDLAEADGSALAPVLAHLGLPAVPLDALPRQNASSTARFGRVHRALLGESWPKRLVRRTLPASIKGALHHHLTRRVLRWNTVATPMRAPSDEERAVMEHYLAEGA